MGFEGEEKCAADTDTGAFWADIAKTNFATPVKRGHPNESGVDRTNDQTVIEVGAPDIEVFGGLVPKPSFEGRSVVPVIHFTQQCDRLSKHVHRVKSICRCREPGRDSAHRLGNVPVFSGEGQRERAKRD